MKLWFQECSKPSHKASQFQTTPILNCYFCHPRFILKLELLVFLEWIVEENRKNLKRLWYGHDFSSFSMMMRMRMIDVCLCIWSSPLGLSLPDLDKSRTGCCILEGFRSSWFSFCCSFMIIFIWAHDGYQAFLKCTANWLCLNKVIDEHIVTKFFQQICNWVFSDCWWNKGVLFQFQNLSFL